ncbi:MAG: hypothetical protein KKG60_00260, partial [Nanoarchaeota archaeon]|nr:hypothetical protein [Nanoarchaeota archaeon]
NIQLIPRRFHDQYWAKEYTGLDWRTLKSPVHQADAFEPSEPYEGTYRHEENKLNPKISRMDSFWINLVGDNKGSIRMCHHDTETTYCGNCFLFPNKGLIAKTNHRTLERWSKRERPKRNEEERNQDKEIKNPRQQELF